MKNIEKYKGIVLKHLSRCDIETDIRKQGGKTAIDCPHTSCEECQEKFFKWLLEEYKEPILDDAERKYLADVIRPFRNKIDTISKFKSWDDNSQYIYIETKDNHFATLPVFPKDTMYKGMKGGRHYSLKELGL
nr:MAG TPA: hypothetical protein [Caudoviricetes sp.]